MKLIQTAIESLQAAGLCPRLHVDVTHEDAVLPDFVRDKWKQRLVIDLDPQGNASTALGVEHRSETVSVYDVIINDEPMAGVVQKSPEFEGLYCVPATIHLAGAEIELVSLVAREQRLRTALELFLAQSEDQFHYVFIDCPPVLPVTDSLVISRHADATIMTVSRRSGTRPQRSKNAFALERFRRNLG